MAAALHALDYLAQIDKHTITPVVVLFGDDAFLKRLTIRSIRGAVLGDGDAEFSHTVFSGGAAQLSEVLDELSTVALFGGGRRFVTVEDADEFVSRYRGQLEDFVGQPRGNGVLLLDVKTWPSNTRLYKAVASKGLNIDCSTPNAGKLHKWLPAWAKQQYAIRLEPAAVDLLLEIVGPELGLLDQELAKLTSAAGSDTAITVEVVEELVGGWRAKTTWEMLDAALAGEAPRALRELERLLLSGENAVGVLAQMSSTLRRFATATRIVQQAEASGSRASLRTALEEAGFKSFILGKAESQLRQLGRERGERLYSWLLETDLGLKGQSAQEPRAVLEQLIVLMAKVRAAGYYRSGKIPFSAARVPCPRSRGHDLGNVDEACPRQTWAWHPVLRSPKALGVVALGSPLIRAKNASTLPTCPILTCHGAPIFLSFASPILPGQLLAGRSVNRTFRRTWTPGRLDRGYRGSTSL